MTGGQAHNDHPHLQAYLNQARRYAAIPVAVVDAEESLVLQGIVVGAKAPIMLPSCSDPPVARLGSAALAVIMHYQENPGS